MVSDARPDRNCIRANIFSTDFLLPQIYKHLSVMVACSVVYIFWVNCFYEIFQSLSSNPEYQCDFRICFQRRAYNMVKYYEISGMELGQFGFKV